jgi:NitT/TauT family transport system substrate-binding protein
MAAAMEGVSIARRGRRFWRRTIFRPARIGERRKPAECRLAATSGGPTILLALMCLMTACGSRSGMHPNATRVRLALQPPTTNNYPSHFAQWLGYFHDEGLDVEISQIAGASKVLEAVVGGSADVGGGVYEQAIQMAAEGRDVVSFVSLLRSPNFALVTLPARGVKSIADLRGKVAGVSSVGSPSQFYLNRLLTASGIPSDSVSATTIGVGAAAMASVEHGQVDAAILFGSAITALQSQRPDVVLLADTRTPEGLRAVFGVDDYPASCLLARQVWLQANPDVARKMARAMLRSLGWIREHSAEEILARLPGENEVGDRAAELAAIRMAKPMYSIDGRISPESAEAVRRVRGEKVDLAKTYTNEFLK